MKTLNPILGLLLVAFLSLECAAAHCEAASKRTRLRLTDPIPTDQSVKIGDLENGLRYYIKKNANPEHRAYLLLAVDVGSVLEDDDQLGIAHFVEHMGFNGTKHFPKHEIIKYLQSVGVAFGGCGGGLNAYTGFDQTVYVLKVPTDTLGVMEKSFQILEDWARWANQDDEEIDKERGVIVEEWRRRLGARERYLQKQLPVIFKDSRYAVRLPIGNREAIETFSSDALRRFYRDWYRPDLVAVIAVGDFDPSRIEQLIREHFGPMPAAENPRPRTVYEIPDHDDMIVSVETDPEDASEGFTLYFMTDHRPRKTVADYRDKFIAKIHDYMFNQRLAELSMTEDPAVLGAGGRTVTMVRTKDLSYLSGWVPEGGLARGIETVLTEVARVKHHGFNQGELDRVRNKWQRIDEWIDQEDKTRSSYYASKCLFHFLRDEPILNPRIERELNDELLPDITLEDVNGILGERFSETTIALLVTAPEKCRDALPPADSLSALFSRIEGREAAAISDDDLDSRRPLLAREPEPGQITDEKVIQDLGITEWTLSNGVHVLLKPTDFVRNRIFFHAWSPGGTSLCSDEVYPSARAASWLIGDCGFGDFDRPALKKKLMNTIAYATPQILELTEEMHGKALMKDVERMFQLLYLRFTAPVACEDVLRKHKNTMIEWLKNKDADPRGAFMDTLSVLLSQNHPRRRPVSTPEEIEAIDLDAMYRIYRDRFADASDFTFIFIGDFDTEELEPLVLTYVGSLPSIGREETWRDVGVRPPEGVIRKVIHRGIEQQSQVAIVFTGPFDWSRRNEWIIRAMGDALREKLRDTLREDMSGTYGVAVWPSVEEFPISSYEFTIGFDCTPERADELVRAVFTQIDSLKTVDCDGRTVSSIKEIYRRQFEERTKTNAYWYLELEQACLRGEDPREILKEPEYACSFDAAAIREAAQKYLRLDNYVQLVRMPEATTEAAGSAK